MLKGKQSTRAWLSKWLRKAGYSSRIVQPTNPVLISPDARAKGIDFLCALRALKKGASQFLFVDKISFGITKRGAREIAQLGSGTIHRPHAELGVPIHVYSSLVGDGRTGAFFAVIARKKGVRVVLNDDDGTIKLIQKGNRRGERSVLAFLEDAVKRGKLCNGDVLVTDNEASWNTEEVNTYISAHGILHHFYPRYLGARLDPCDNSFHAVFRRMYQAEILQLQRVDLHKRLEILNRVYHAIPDRDVLGFVRHCGLLEGDPERVIDDLLLEGTRPRGGITAQMRLEVNAYLDYKVANNWSEPDEPGAAESDSDNEDEEGSSSDSESHDDE
jgi:hypothetical protein